MSLFLGSRPRAGREKAVSFNDDGIWGEGKKGELCSREKRRSQMRHLDGVTWNVIKPGRRIVCWEIKAGRTRKWGGMSISGGERHQSKNGGKSTS